MERYSSRTLDEAGRLVVHSEIRQKLGLEAGGKVSLTHVGNLIIVQRAENCAEESGCVCSPVSELGQLEIPAALRQSMGWIANSKIAAYLTDDMIILKSA